MKTFIRSIALSLLLSFIILHAQELSVSTYSVSPYDVATDSSSEHYFDRRFTGLLNVGRETKVFLKGEFTDSILISPMWTIIEKPTGSAASFGPVKNINSSVQLDWFIPDITGTYKIQFTDGTEADTIVINCALYYGVQDGGCNICHTNDWASTGHATMLQRGLNGEFGNNYGVSCIGCHTTGNDPNAGNNGFDDFSFVFPDSLYPGVYEQTVALYPDAMKRANVQCESCHGPASNHFPPIFENSMVASIDYGVCAYCHDAGNDYFIPSQWKKSVHATGTNFFAGNSRFTCTPCHNGQGFIDAMDGEQQSVQKVFNITCASCHDPHSADNVYQLRAVTATLENGYEFTDGGAGGVCANCHHSREDAVPYVTEYLSNLSRFGPHHGPQSDILAGTNVYTWGNDLPTSPHLYATDNACADCHMSSHFVDLGTDIPFAGGHTFSMTFPDGTDNVAACEPCHGSFGEEFSDKKFFYNGNADLDGDGVAQGLQLEIEGLMDSLIAHLPQIGPSSMPIDSSWTLDQAAAYYNLANIQEDRSLGIHNPLFVTSLLYLSIQKVGGIVLHNESNENELPADFSLEQNYPNPFNPSTTITFVVPEQSNVKITVYDAIGNEVEVLLDGVVSAGIHSLIWNADGYASGIYLYKLQSDHYTMVKKMLLVK